MKKELSKRDKVLKTALQMVASGGFHASPMSEIATMSGVAVGTIYHHFASKDDLMVALYLKTKENMSKAMEPFAQSKLSPTKKLEVMSAELQLHFLKNPLEFSFLDQFQSSPFVDIQSGEDLFAKPITDVFKEGVKAGKLRKLHIDVLSELFYNSVLTFVRMQLSTQKKKVSKKDIQLFAEMTLSALRK
jgi:AcrR family transcriptional regulator